MMSHIPLKPVERKFEASFIKIDIENFKNNIRNIVSKSEKYFSELPDIIYWELINEDGKLYHENGIGELDDILNKCDNMTGIFSLKLSKITMTSHKFFRKFPEEYLTITIDFWRRKLYSTASFTGEAKFRIIYELLTSGLKLVGLELPSEHHYLEIFLQQFHQDHPEFEKNVFLIMRFQDQPPFENILRAIQDTCGKLNLKVLRADNKEYTDDLWDNVMTYMYGCKSAIAVFDQINYREFNPNVAMEVGFLLSQCKKVLLLKDLAIPVMPTDIAGKIYRPFNTHDPRGTIPPQIEKWVSDYGIGS
jgi:hypothetical protein